MGRKFNTERHMYAGRQARDYVAQKRAAGAQKRQWQMFASNKLSPEEKAAEEARQKKEAKEKAAEEYRRKIEEAYGEDAASEGADVEDKAEAEETPVVEVMLLVSETDVVELLLIVADD
ncbi:hypothetical protein CYMTET_33914 [Cymbomonas tetramitiformis]|uniref:Uncharacterized protein n=1 Tax=Cymbomonas tetramitiformis TaxID=36881 RepID=A0AAE0FC64_9CHLO|nr:hypothetical protein CYMTET_33914 [Cymbomonas tetramitiformis]|eukprot:gene5127-6236_t